MVSDRVPATGLGAQGIFTSARIHWNVRSAPLVEAAVARGEGRLAADGPLVVETGRVEGSGAGMDPPEGSVFRNGGWDYRPNVAPLPKLLLAASGATVGGWSLCVAGRPCLTLGAKEGPPISVEPCHEKTE